MRRELGDCDWRVYTAMYTAQKTLGSALVTSVGRKFKKRGVICIHMTDSLCYLTQDCKATMCILLSHMSDFVTPRTVALTVSSVHGICQARIQDSLTM